MKRLFILLCMFLTNQSACLVAAESPTLRFLAERAPANLGEVVLAVGDKLSSPFMLSTQRLRDRVMRTLRWPVLTCSRS